MLSTLIAVFPIALGAAAASLPVIAMAAVLATLNSRTVLLTFTAGWVTGVFVTTVITLGLVDGAIEVTDSSDWIAWLRLALGIVVLGLAARKFISYTRQATTTDDPSWMVSMRRTTDRQAFGIAFLLGSINPKNLVIVVAAVSAITSTSMVAVHQIAGVILFTIIASLGVAAPAIAIAIAGERATVSLSAFVQWFARHSDVVLGIVLLVLGLMVALNGLSAIRS